MARIKIEELPVMEDIDAQETKGIFGGFNPQPEPPLKSFGFRRRSIRGIGVRRSARKGVFGSLSQRGIVIVDGKPGGTAGGAPIGFLSPPTN